MACLIQRPDPQVLFDQIKNNFSSTVLGGAAVVPQSNEWYVVSLNYATYEEYFAISEQQLRERDPRYACCDNLVDMAAMNGIYPLAASFASGYVRLSGTAGSPLPISIELVASNGKTYLSSGTVPPQLDVNGQAIIQVRALEPGIESNASGEVTSGTLSTPIAGVNNAVEICGGRFCGGAAAEECEPFRTRYLDRMQYKPRARSEDLKNILLTWPCATRVFDRGGTCCTTDYPCATPECACEGCGNRLQYYVLFDGAFDCGIAPLNIIDDLNTWMFGTIPGAGQGQVDVGVCGSVKAINPLPVNVVIEIQGCPTAAQQTLMNEDIQDFFLTIAPSTMIMAQQISLIVANIIGANININSRITAVTQNETIAYESPCGDIEPACDYLPCLNSIQIIGPTSSGTGGCV